MEQLFTISGKSYTTEALKSQAALHARHSKEYEQEFWDFVNEWYSDSPYVEVQTSGSTGAPKRIKVSKEHMANSAQMTLKALGLEPGDNALLCLSVAYIGGKMMVVRALVGGLNLSVVEPTGTPSIVKDYQFAAMVPLQVYNLLSNPDEDLSINRIGKLIIGGGPISGTLKALIKPLPIECYATFGMTETVSHIALRRLNGDSRQGAFYPLEGVSITLNSKGCLVVDAPRICSHTITTNDIAEIHPDGSFKVLGRLDNVINTGGVKVIPEAVEAKLCGCAKNHYAISSLPDAKLGEMVVLVVEGSTDCLFNFVDMLAPYERPKQVIHLDRIPLTSNGKIDRIALRKAILNVGDFNSRKK